MPLSMYLLPFDDELGVHQVGSLMFRLVMQELFNVEQYCNWNFDFLT
jgi:hypothetical protein